MYEVRAADKSKRGTRIAQHRYEFIFASAVRNRWRKRVVDGGVDFGGKVRLCRVVGFWVVH